MERKCLLTAVSMVLCVGLLLACPVLAGAGASKPGRTIDPIVSTEWLAANSNSPKLVILDVRSPDEYKAGHIAGSISAPFGFSQVGLDHGPQQAFSWKSRIPRNCSKTIGSLGIQADSRVVVISAPTPAGPGPVLRPGQRHAGDRYPDLCRRAQCGLHGRRVSQMDVREAHREHKGCYDPSRFPSRAR